MRQPNWNQYETALLIETYWKIQKTPFSKKREITKLSLLLRRLAIYEGLKIDDTYRNNNGIHMRVAEIEYLFSFGNSGLNHSSYQFKEMVNMYITDPERYKNILVEAKKRICHKEIISEQFELWLIDYVPRVNFLNVCKCLSIAESYSLKTKILNKPIFETIDEAVIEKMIQTLSKNKIFYVINKKNYCNVMRSLNWYHAFTQAFSLSELPKCRNLSQNQPACSNVEMYYKVNLPENIETAGNDENISETLELEAVQKELVPRKTRREQTIILPLPEEQTEQLVKDEPEADYGTNCVDRQKYEKKISAEFTYAQLYNLDSKEFDAIKLSQNNFSVRTYGCLIIADILTAGDLLRSNENALRNIYGFGQKCVDEVNDFLKSLKPEIDETANASKTADVNASNIFFEYRDSIYQNDFSFESSLELNEHEAEYLSKFKEAHTLLDKELILNIKSRPEYVAQIQLMLQKLVVVQNQWQKLRDSLYCLPKERLNTKSINYIYAYSDDAIVRKILQNFYDDENSKLKEVRFSFSYNEGNFRDFLEFTRWCLFDIEGEISKLFSMLYKKETTQIVLSERARKRTLEEVGETLNITRERVRQIEVSAKKKFLTWYNQSNLLGKIYALRNGDNVLTSAELREYFGDYATELLYLLKSTKGLPFIYDLRVDAFIIDDNDQPEKIRNFIEELPETFGKERLESILESVQMAGLNSELFNLTFNETYSLSGNIYHRSKLSIHEICRLTLKKYYPDGINVYNDQSLAEFRNNIKKDFGDVKLPQRNRALSVHITFVGILCDRGKYKAYDGQTISDALLEKICQYIDGSDKTIFLMNTIFSVFEDDLLNEGIDNKYFLQGVLHRQLKDKYEFSRDYISKDESVTSVYMEVVNYIKRFDHPINKDQIFAEFPGMTEIVFNLAISDSDVINLFGEYIYGPNLKFFDADVKYFETVLKELLSENGFCNTKDIFYRINAENPISLRRLFIFSQRSLFAVLEYLFGSEYQFSRPYIAYPNVEIAHAQERIDELVRNAEEITLSEIKAYARKIHYNINNILNFVNQYNDTHILKNDKEMISIQAAGIDRNCAMQIESAITDEISGTKPISELKCIYKFPAISVPWSEWLIYSIINKWSTKLEVGVKPISGTKQFKSLIPIIALKGELSADGLIINDKDTIEAIDNLDDIDDLIADIIVEEIGDFDNYEF